MSGPPHLPHWIRLTSYSYGVSTAMLAVTLLPVAGTVLAYLSVRLQPHAGLGPTGGVGWWGRGVESFLGEVAELAAGLVDPAASVGITVRYGGEFLTVASSDDRAALVDEEQYLEGAGPCLEALRTGQVVEVNDPGSWAPGA